MNGLPGTNTIKMVAITTNSLSCHRVVYGLAILACLLQLLVSSGCTILDEKKQQDEVPPKELAKLFDNNYKGNLESGIAAHHSHDYYKALHELYPLAKSGNAQAQMLLGVMFAKGQGVPANESFARYWLTLAAKQQDAEAQNVFAKLLNEGHYLKQDKSEALTWFAKAAKNGNAEAQFYLSSMYQLGDGVKKAKQKSFKWMLASAKQGYGAAQNNLGWMYQNGIGIKQNPDLAEYWYTQAAKKGIASAQYNLSQFYLTAGQRFYDREKSQSWLKQAAANGHEIALKQVLSQVDGKAQPGDAITLFGAALPLATRNILQDRIKEAGAIPLSEDPEQWYDIYDAADLVKGADRLYVGYSIRNQKVGEVKYRFPNHNTPRGVAYIKELITKKYGKSALDGSQYEFTGIHGRWKIDETFIEIKRGFPDNAVILRYIVPKELALMQHEQKEQAPDGTRTMRLETY